MEGAELSGPTRAKEAPFAAPEGGLPQQTKHCWGARPPHLGVGGSEGAQEREDAPFAVPLQPGLEQRTGSLADRGAAVPETGLEQRCPLGHAAARRQRKHETRFVKASRFLNQQDHELGDVGRGQEGALSVCLSASLSASLSLYLSLSLSHTHTHTSSP